MQSTLSASWVTREPRSALDTTATDSTPSAAQARATRTAISPRLAISTRVSVTIDLRFAVVVVETSKLGLIRAAFRLDQHQGLPVLHQLRVLGDHVPDGSPDSGEHGAEALHHLDQPDGGVLLHRAPDGDERTGVRP